MKSFSILLLFIVGLCSCSQRMNCPTTHPKYFYKKMGTTKGGSSPVFYKNKGSRGSSSYIVPYKYRKGIINYGKLK